MAHTSSALRNSLFIQPHHPKGHHAAEKEKLRQKLLQLSRLLEDEDEDEVEVSSSSRQTATKCDRFEPKENKAWLNDIRCQPQARGLPVPLLPQSIFCAFFSE